MLSLVGLMGKTGELPPGDGEDDDECKNNIEKCVTMMLSCAYFVPGTVPRP